MSLYNEICKDLLCGVCVVDSVVVVGVAFASVVVEPVAFKIIDCMDAIVFVSNIVKFI